MATQSLASQQGVLRDWKSAVCSGLLLGKVPSAGIAQMVWVSVVTFLHRIRTQAMSGARTVLSL